MERIHAPFFTCMHCKKRFTHRPVALKGTTWYFIFDHDSSKELMNEGTWKNKLCSRETWQNYRERHDRYSPVYGKLFDVIFNYCSLQCVTA